MSKAPCKYYLYTLGPNVGNLTRSRAPGNVHSVLLGFRVQGRSLRAGAALYRRTSHWSLVIEKNQATPMSPNPQGSSSGTLGVDVHQHHGRRMLDIGGKGT